MHLGLGSYTYGWNIGIPGNIPAVPMSELDLVGKAHENKVSILQIGDNLPLHLFTAARKSHFKAALERNHLTLEIGAKTLNAINIATYIDLAQYFKSTLLRFIIDGDDYRPDLPDIAASIKDFLPELKNNQIRLAIENHDRLRAKDFAWIMDSVGSDQVGICLDCANSLGAGEGLEQVVHILAPYTINLHIKDYQIKRLPHKMGFIVEGVKMGDGILDLAWLLDCLSQHGRCHTAILEQWVPPEKDLDQSCSKERLWADESFFYLKSNFNFS